MRGPDYMLLYYPSTDVARVTGYYPSGDTQDEGFGLDRAFADWVLKSYYADVELRVHPYASAMLSPDFDGVPPAIIAVGGFDMLRDQGSDLAKRMIAEDIRVDDKLYPGMVHSFLQHSYAIEDAYTASVEPARIFGMRIRGQ